MGSLIDVINQMMNTFKKDGGSAIQLPHVVVVGSEGSGKTSILETLVGKSFLPNPKGTGIGTRCPFVLELVHLDKIGAGEMKEWCCFPFASNPHRKYGIDDVHRPIQQLTEAVAGSMDPITLRVYSTNVSTLIVVDLPGIPVLGDQPEEDQVLHLIRNYLDNPNALILAVSSAEADITTSDSLKIAKQVDPTGDRTLVVITKLDQLANGTNAGEVLSGMEVNGVQLLGIIGVVNRSQEDMDKKKSIQEALKDEDAFLRRNYPNHIGTIGSPYLANRLNQLLLALLQYFTLPDLLERIADRTAFYEAEQNKKGPKGPAFIIRQRKDALKNLYEAKEIITGIQSQLQ